MERKDRRRRRRLFLVEREHGIAQLPALQLGGGLGAR